MELLFDLSPLSRAYVYLHPSIHPSNHSSFKLLPSVCPSTYPCSPTNVPVGPAIIICPPPTNPFSQVGQLLSWFCTHVYELSPIKDGASQELCLAQARASILRLAWRQSVPGVPLPLLSSPAYSSACGELSSCPKEPVAQVAPVTCCPQEGEKTTAHLEARESPGYWWGGEVCSHKCKSCGFTFVLPSKPAQILIQVNIPRIKTINALELSTPWTRVFFQQLFPTTQLYR